MYYRQDVIKKTNRGKKIIKNLFSKIKKNPKKFIVIEKETTQIERSICDFIAGMTDRYAIKLNNKIK